ncbi:MAG: serine protein kinase [Lentisphaerae bacterium GWF2_45_14]|nr:MAG: serine protein kinase [Lentisphaerae bacterium GWF2_45_14]
MKKKEDQSLDFHVREFAQGSRRFENVYESISRMILTGPDAFRKTKVNGRTTYDFSIFRNGHKHLVGLYDEINSFVSFVKDAAENGSSSEMAFVLVGEPGNGKTYFVEYLCRIYREFLSKEENRRYTFKFMGMDKLGTYGKISDIESQTYEDPTVLAMNLYESREENIKYCVSLGLKEKTAYELFDRKYRSLGACSDYILSDIREYTGGNIEEMKKFIKIIPVPMSETLGTVTGKYSARDKITSSAKDLLGEESVQRLLHISDTSNPYRIDLRVGALARVGGGGIHFSDEMFKNKKDLVQVYLGVIQNRNIEIDGYKWPIDTLIVATSNNEEFNRFVSEKEEAPIVDRCRICYIGHNTNYKLQEELTSYALGSLTKTTMSGESLHIDPNLNFAASNSVVLSRLPRSEKLTPLEVRKLAAGEVAGDKSVKALIELIDDLQKETDITKRFGQRGIGHRNLGRAIQLVIENSETQEGRCMFAGNIFRGVEQIILDYVKDPNFRAKYLEDLKTAKSLYREKVRTDMFNAYMDEPHAIRKEVMNYVNMVVAIDSQEVGPDNMWRYADPATGEAKAIKIDDTYIKSVEERLGLKNNEQKESFRTTIRRIYGRKAHTDPNYDFMDNNELVKAVTDVRLQSDVAGAGSLVGALANRTNEENEKLYSRIIKTMMEKLSYCKTCAQKTIDYFCTRQDES